MPDYTIRDPRSNKTITVRGDSPPTEQELHQIFAKLNSESVPMPASAAWDLPQSVAGQQATPPVTSAQMGASAPSFSDQAMGFVRGAWNVVNPVNAVKAGVAAVNDPLGTIKQVGAAQGQLGQDAIEAFKKGDLPRAARKGINWMLPVVGPAIDAAADKFEQGQYGEGAGESMALGATLYAPKTLMGRSASIPSQSRVNPTTQAAVQWGESRGIPIDAATATDSRFVRAAQQRASNSMGGAGVAERFKGAQEQAFAREGGLLADSVHPRTVSPEQAGRGVIDAVEGNVRKHHGDADAAYARLRALEQQQAQRISQSGGVQAPPGATFAESGAQRVFTDVPLAVDVQATKAALKPLYDSLLRESQLTTLQGGKARTLVALDRLMTGPDIAPLSQVDAALSDLKAMARTDGMPELRTPGQASAAEAVKQLDAQVISAAKRGGQPVIQALNEGRSATVSKYRSGEVLKQLRDEPVQVFQQATWRNDAGIERLREIAREAPGEMPKVGRAYLDSLMDVATAEGGFGRAQGLWGRWQSLGPATKAMLFPDAALRRELNNFFLLAKKAAENPNPSGTATVLTVLNAASIPATYGLSRLFHSPAGVRMLTRGLSIPIGNKAASAAWQAEIANLIGRESQAAGLPAAAEDRTQESAPTEP